MHTYLPPTRDGDPYTVGHYTPENHWVALKDFTNEVDAEWHVHFLNGGSATRDVGFDDVPDFAKERPRVGDPRANVDN